MRTFVLEREVRIPRLVEELFPFFADPRNLESITPPWLRFRVVASTDEGIREGTEIDYELRLHGVPIRWRSRISVWDPPWSFVDEQLSGPYRKWHHLHTFEPDGEETVVRDRVTYAMFGGWLAEKMLVRRDLDRIFDYRTERLLQLLST